VTSARVQIESGQPVIISQPSTQAVAPATTATFTVGVRGFGLLRYRWQKNINSVFSDIESATNATFLLQNAQNWDAGDYRVIVTNVIGATTSVVARLYVMIPGILTNQLVLDNFDDNRLEWGSITGGGCLRATVSLRSPELGLGQPITIG